MMQLQQAKQESQEMRERMIDLEGRACGQTAAVDRCWNIMQRLATLGQGDDAWSLIAELADCVPAKNTAAVAGEVLPAMQPSCITSHLLERLATAQGIEDSWQAVRAVNGSSDSHVCLAEKLTEVEEQALLAQKVAEAEQEAASAIQRADALEQQLQVEEDRTERQQRQLNCLNARLLEAHRQVLAKDSQLWRLVDQVTSQTPTDGGASAVGQRAMPASHQVSQNNRNYADHPC